MPMLPPRVAAFCSTLSLLLLVTASAAHAQTTALRLESDPGDDVGRGLHQTWTTAGATFSPSGSTSSGVSISVSSGSRYWYLHFAAPQGSSLVTGVYDPAYDTNYGAPRIDVYGSYGSCDVTTGRFVVLEIAFNPNGALARFAADFEQHCDDADPALLGAVRFNSTIATLTPFGGAPRTIALIVAQPAHGEVTAQGIACGGGNTDCAESYGEPSDVVLTATPEAGYLFLAWTGDCAGGVSPVVARVNRGMRCSAWFNAIAGTGGTDPSVAGEGVVYLDGQVGAKPFSDQRAILRSSAGALFTVQSATAGTIQIVVREAHGGGYSTFTFKAPESAALVPGSYEYAISSYSNGPAPGLDVTVRYDSCSERRGRFVIHEVEVSSGALVRFAADFEQHCNGDAAALFGAVRFNATRASLVPFEGAYPTYQLHARSEGAGKVVATGIDCGIDCDQAFTSPTFVAVTAVPDPGFVFAGWAEDCTGAATTVINVNLQKRCSAVFSPLPATVAAPLDIDTLILDSQVGDYIGQGQRAAWTERSSRFIVRSATAGKVRLEVTTPDGSYWDVELVAPLGESLLPGGVYEFATGDTYQDSFIPGLHVWGHGRSCTESLGRFVIYEITFAFSGALESLAVDFEQHCDGNPALFGSLRFNATRASVVPFDGAYPAYQLHVASERGGTIVGAGIDCGPDCDETFAAPTVVTFTAVPTLGFVFAGWAEDCAGAATATIFVDQRKRCTAIFSPSPGAVAVPLDTDTLLLDSDAGDYVGQGLRAVWTGRSSRFWVISATPAIVRIMISVPDGRDVEVDLAAPLGSTLTAGRTYNFAVGYSYQAVSAPSLSVSRDYRSCGSYGTGRFVVHEISFAAGGTLTSLAADFEQHCSAAIPGLRGSLRYHASRAELIPYAGEGRSRLVFRHSVSGEMVQWIMTGWTRVASSTFSPSRANTNWRLAGHADLDGDGDADILWQEETSSDLFVWLMDGTYRLTSRYLSIPRPADPLWKVVSLADMNGDGKLDLVWQHAASGALAAWMLNGTTVTDRVSLDPSMVADPNWKVVTTGDFNGDGKADLLWRHATEGYLVVWMMDGIHRTSVEWLNPSQLRDLGWHVASTGDLNGDGKTDIVFQHSDGRLVLWLMDGLIRTSSQMLAPDHVVDPNWRIAGPR